MEEGKRVEMDVGCTIKTRRKSIFFMCTALLQATGGTKLDLESIRARAGSVDIRKGRGKKKKKKKNLTDG
jgi:hypothetical protein